MSEQELLPTFIPSTPIDNPKAIRELCDNIWNTCHDNELPQEQMLMRLSLLSGMAVAALLEYARSMEPTTKSGERV
jgi:hypothetical protein